MYENENYDGFNVKYV